jgi:Flp pilus assembly protein TadG
MRYVGGEGVERPWVRRTARPSSTGEEMVRVRQLGLSREDGASAVEFAIVASVLLMVLFGTIQFGIAYNRYQGLNAAAREGARVGSLQNTTVDTIRSRVLSSLSIIDPTNFSSSYTCPGTLNTDQGCIEVSQQDTTSGNYTVLTSGTAVPCDPSHSTANLKVSATYKTLVQIPLWKSASVTMSGDGIFKCE